MPVPSTLISIPVCWADSTAPRIVLPRNEGTSMPLLVSSTTVPLFALAGVSAGELAADNDIVGVGTPEFELSDAVGF